MPIPYVLAAIIIMLLGALGLYWLRHKGPDPTVRRWSEATSWIALGFGLLFSLETLYNPLTSPPGYFSVGPLQALLIPYILLMGVLVKRYAYHYLQSDEAYAAFFLKIKLLMAALIAFVALNHALLLTFTWMCSGWLMYSLIAHTRADAALSSAKLALKTFVLGDIFLLGGVCGMAYLTQSFYLSDWFSASGQQFSSYSALFLASIAIGAISKTALLPFHQWLAHTLTAPTPVSAVMHAGFVNSGGILLAKLSPLVVQHPVLMMAVFSVGLLSALFGSTAMLVQTDVKRYLTFSTIGQMGFMIMECGLGAFHLAILHLIIHGFFKARLFLTSGTVIEHRSAIRNVQYQKVRSTGLAGMAEKFYTAALILVLCVLIGWLVSSVSAFNIHLLQLHPVLGSVLVLAVLFASSVLIKTKGYGVKGLIIAFIFGVSLVSLYILYEAGASQLLIELNYSHITQSSLYYLTSATLLLIGGIIGWLINLNLLPLPVMLKQKAYVRLLNATGGLKAGTTFTHRTAYAHDSRN